MAYRPDYLVIEVLLETESIVNRKQTAMDKLVAVINAITNPIDVQLVQSLHQSCWSEC
ncbi:MAG: hypothetical protein ABI977_26415 [Acidobacteriota bacterium]